MNIGDIVRLKPNHPLEEFIEGNCVIDEKKYTFSKERFHIKTIDGKNCMTWVTAGELDLIMDLRDKKLNQILIVNQ